MEQKQFQDKEGKTAWDQAQEYIANLKDQIKSYKVHIIDDGVLLEWENKD